MARRGLLSNFVNSWVRQMGRESAHTAYGDITGKNTREYFGEVKETRSFPSIGNYIKLFLPNGSLLLAHYGQSLKAV